MKIDDLISLADSTKAAFEKACSAKVEANKLLSDFVFERLNVYDKYFFDICKRAEGVYSAPEILEHPYSFEDFELVSCSFVDKGFFIEMYNSFLRVSIDISLPKRYFATENLADAIEIIKEDAKRIFSDLEIAEELCREA